MTQGLGVLPLVTAGVIAAGAAWKYFTDPGIQRDVDKVGGRLAETVTGSAEQARLEDKLEREGQLVISTPPQWPAVPGPKAQGKGLEPWDPELMHERHSAAIRDWQTNYRPVITRLPVFSEGAPFLTAPTAEGQIGVAGLALAAVGLFLLLR